MCARVCVEGGDILVYYWWFVQWFEVCCMDQMGMRAHGPP